ncbi:MAG: hypothetical protein ACYC67_06530 [Prosthecobacter sp.]
MKIFIALCAGLEAWRASSPPLLVEWQRFIISPPVVSRLFRTQAKDAVGAGGHGTWPVKFVAKPFVNLHSHFIIAAWPRQS